MNLAPPGHSQPKARPPVYVEPKRTTTARHPHLRDGKRLRLEEDRVDARHQPAEVRPQHFQVRSQQRQMRPQRVQARHEER